MSWTKARQIELKNKLGYTVKTVLYKEPSKCTLTLNNYTIKLYSV